MLETPPARRLEAGDWVMACNAAAAVTRGLGKLTGGDYDAEVLVRARVEFPWGVRTVVPGDLVRLGPNDEANLVEHALDSGRVPKPTRARLERKLDAIRSGAEPFLRTPGLLDALWAVLRDSRGPGLAELFESRADTIRALLASRASPRRWGPLPGPRVVPLALPTQATPRPTPLPTAAPALRRRHRREQPRPRTKTPRKPQLTGPLKGQQPFASVMPGYTPTALPSVDLEEELRVIRALVAAGQTLPWEKLKRLMAFRRAEAVAYLQTRVEHKNLVLAARFGSFLAALALDLYPRHHVPTYRSESAADFDLAFDGRWQPALAYLHETLRDVADRLCASLSAPKPIRRELDLYLNVVSDWRANGGGSKHAARALFLKVSASERAKRCRRELPRGGPAVALLLLALGELTCVCSPLEVEANADSPDTVPLSESRVRAVRCFRMLPSVRAAIEAFRDASPEEQAQHPTARKTLRWIEVRAGDALERWLLTGSSD